VGGTLGFCGGVGLREGKDRSNVGGYVKSKVAWAHDVRNKYPFTYTVVFAGVGLIRKEMVDGMWADAYNRDTEIAKHSLFVDADASGTSIDAPDHGWCFVLNDVS
jgi:hypothetical protein